MTKKIQGAIEENAEGDYSSDLYEQAPCGYVITEPGGLIAKANSTFLDWTGYCRNDLIGKKRFQDLLSPSGKVFHDTHFGPLLHMQGYANELAFDIVCANGQRLSAILNSRLLRDTSGAPKLVLITLLKTSQRRSYEQELLAARRNAESAAAEVRRLNTALEELLAATTAERDRLWRLSKDILAIGSLDGKFIAANPAFTSLLGWDASEVSGMSMETIVPNEDRDEFRRNMQLLGEGQSLFGVEVRRKAKSGTFIWISWNIIVEQGLLYMIGRDVTEDRRQRLLLQQAEDNLRQAAKMEAVGQLTGGIAHDFNNLLAGMVGNLQLMRVRLGQGKTEDLTRYIDAAEAVADRATSLTQRLLAYSRKQTLQTKPTSVNERIAFMLDLIERTVGPGIDIETQLNPHIHPALSDANQLETALLNLAINARDAMPGGGRLVVKTEGVALHDQHEAHAVGLTSGDYVLISIADTGCGMAPNVLKRAFDPFFTTKPIGQGTGLGLSMVYGFVRQSGGQVRIDSGLNAGTTVKMFLPVSLDPVVNDSEKTDLVPSFSSKKDVNVVLVDDEAPLRMLLAEVLDDAGYQVHQAESGVAALEIFHGPRRVDLLITDVGLGGTMTGKQLADTAHAQWPDLQVLLITGYPDKAVERGTLAEAGFEIMFKPFSLNEFSEKVAALLAIGR